jgi:hypothetical protein
MEVFRQACAKYEAPLKELLEPKGYTVTMFNESWMRIATPDFFIMIKTGFICIYPRINKDSFDYYEPDCIYDADYLAQDLWELPIMKKSVEDSENKAHFIICDFVEWK